MDRSDYTENEFAFAEACLKPGEAILWRGKPGRGKIFTAVDVFLIPFSILWCGFAVFWEIIALSSGAPIFFALFGLPFVLVGLYMVFGRYAHASLLRRRTYYVITTNRILAKRGNRMTVLNGKDLPPQQILFHKNGYGTIRFGEEGYHYRGGRSYRIAPALTLENIPDVVGVQRLLQNTFYQ